MVVGAQAGTGGTIASDVEPLQEVMRRIIQNINVQNCIENVRSKFKNCLGIDGFDKQVL